MRSHLLSFPCLGFRFFRFLRLFILRFSSNFPHSFHPPSIPVLSDPVFLAAEVSGAESVSPSQSPERVSGVCVHPVSSLFVSPPHSPFRAPQAAGGLFILFRIGGGGAV